MDKSIQVIAFSLIALCSFTVLIVPSVLASNEVPKILWSNTYGPYLGLAIIQTADSSLAIAGQNATFKPFSPHEPEEWVNYTALLVRLDEQGNRLSEKTYENEIGFGSFTNGANSIIQSSDLGYVLCGNNWILKLSSDERVEWNRTFSSVENCKAIQTNDGGYAIIGNSQVNANTSSVNSEMIKTNSNGDILWTKIFSANSTIHDVYARSLVQTTDGGYAVVGSWYGNFWFAKTDSSGDLVINQTYPGSSFDGASFRSISKTNDGGFVLAGYAVDNSKYTAYVVKTDSQGNTQWIFNHDEPSSELLHGAEFYSVSQTTDNGYVAVGYPAIVKLSSNGQTEWNMTGYNAYSITTLKNGGFAVTGSQGTGSDQQLWAAVFATEATAVNPSLQEYSSVIILAIVILVVMAFGIIYLKKKGRLR